jgi:hypothetical protein
LRVRVRDAWLANQWLNVGISGEEGNYLLGEVRQAERSYDSKITCASA